MGAKIKKLRAQGRERKGKGRKLKGREKKVKGKGIFFFLKTAYCLCSPDSGFSEKKIHQKRELHVHWGNYIFLPQTFGMKTVSVEGTVGA